MIHILHEPEPYLKMRAYTASGLAAAKSLKSKPIISYTLLGA